MAVRSQPMREAKDSAVVSRARLRKQRGAIERFTAFLVLFLSFLGSVVTLHGGWVPLIESLAAARPVWWALLGGIGLQLLLTYLEWHYFDRVAIAWPARVADTALTALGYGPLVVGRLTAALATEALPDATIPAWIIIGIVSFLAAWYPESRLVD